MRRSVSCVTKAMSSDSERALNRREHEGSNTSRIHSGRVSS